MQDIKPTVNEILYFNNLCTVLENVQNAKGLQNKKEIFRRGLTKLREDAKFVVQGNYDSFYQIMRLIVPGMDHGRKSYNMKENRIAKVIVKMLNLPEGLDKRNLLNYCRISDCNNTFDFAHVVCSTLRKYISTKESTYTIVDVNNSLDAIANRDSDVNLDDVMLLMFRNLNNTESKWVIRIILKKLKLGIDNNKILNIFHQDAAEFYSSNNNLRKVCEVLWHPSVKLNEFSIHMFEPFQPMLSKRCDANTFTKDFPDRKLLLVENKFDGERFQLHMENGKFKYFSRNGFDFTDHFGETFSNGILTPKLKDVFHINVKRIILDGEMMLWNKKIEKFGSKGMTFDVKKLKEYGYYQPCFCVFDILLLNEEVLTNKDLLKRLKLLQSVVQCPKEGVIILSSYRETNSRQEIIDILNKSMDNNEEGIVVKDPKSLYKFHDRKGGWYKIKMEYFDDNVTDLDLIMMGGFYKKNSNDFTTFLVGVYSGDDSKTVLSLGKVYSGLNFEELELVNKRLKEKGKLINEFESKSGGKLIFGKEIPDIWIEPEESLTFVIRATELIRSNNAFRTPFTFRFPRILRVREDKIFNECLSTNELLELCQQNKSVIKLNRRHLELEEVLRLKKKRKTKQLLVDVEALKKVSNCLGGLKLYVLTGTEQITREKIEETIEKYGGTFTLSLERDVNIVLVGILSSEVKELLKYEHKFDIIKVEWLQRIGNLGYLQKYKQEEVLSIGSSYYNCLADDVDMYGDSYTEELNEETLKLRLDYMAEREYITNQNGSVLFINDFPVFNRYIAYFDTNKFINDSSSEIIYNSFLDEIEFQYRQGTISNVLSSEVNLIIMGTSDEERKLMLEQYATSINCPNFQVISSSKLYQKEEF